MDIIEFSKGLGIELTPVQRVVLKTIYEVPLDRTIEFEVKSFNPVDRSFPIVTYTEESYFSMLLAESRLQGSAEDCEVVVLVSGRRSGKDTLSSLISAFEVFRQLDSPRQTNTEEIVLVSHVTDSANLLYQSFRELVQVSEPLLSRLANDGRNYGSFQRSQDIEEDQSWRGSQRTAVSSIHVKVSAANSRGLRGRVSRLVCLNEFGAFPLSSAEQVLSTSRGLVRTLKGFVFLTGTPVSPGGSPFRTAASASSAAREGDPNRLIMRIPTWEMNSSIDLSRFVGDNLVRFIQEFGAEFLDEVKLVLPTEWKGDLRPFLEEQDLPI